MFLSFSSIKLEPMFSFHSCSLCLQPPVVSQVKYCVKCSSTKEILRKPAWSQQWDHLEKEARKERRSTAENVAPPTPAHPKSAPLPSILLAHVLSLQNKLDELHANVSCQWLSKDTGLICVTETWLDSTIADSQPSLSGFGTPIRLDRDTVRSQKKYGGGGCVYANQA